MRSTSWQSPSRVGLSLVSRTAARSDARSSVLQRVRPDVPALEVSVSCLSACSQGEPLGGSERVSCSMSDCDKPRAYRGDPSMASVRSRHGAMTAPACVLFVPWVSSRRSSGPVACSGADPLPLVHSRRHPALPGGALCCPAPSIHKESICAIQNRAVASLHKTSSSID